jgi:hypothetical protein
MGDITVSFKSIFRFFHGASVQILNHNTPKKSQADIIELSKLAPQVFLDLDAVPFFRHSSFLSALLASHFAFAIR